MTEVKGLSRKGSMLRVKLSKADDLHGLLTLICVRTGFEDFYYGNEGEENPNDVSELIDSAFSMRNKEYEMHIISGQDHVFLIVCGKNEASLDIVWRTIEEVTKT